MHLSLLFTKYLNIDTLTQEWELKGNADEALEGHTEFLWAIPI